VEVEVELEVEVLVDVLVVVVPTTGGVAKTLLKSLLLSCRKDMISNLNGLI